MTIEDESLLKVVNRALQKERRFKTLSYATEIPISECGQRTPSDAEGQKTTATSTVRGRPGLSEMERSVTMSDKPSNSAREQFLRKLRTNLSYIRFTRISGFDPGRRERFEESCWLHHCAALQNELKGARAKRTLAHLTAFRSALGDQSWLPDQVVSWLDSLQDELRLLASKGRRGRPKDTIARALRRNMTIFVPPVYLPKRTARSLSREEFDEILGDLLGVICGRKVSAATIKRMRARERVRRQAGQNP